MIHFSGVPNSNGAIGFDGRFVFLLFFLFFLLKRISVSFFLLRTQRYGHAFHVDVQLERIAVPFCCSSNGKPPSIPFTIADWPVMTTTPTPRPKGSLSLADQEPRCGQGDMLAPDSTRRSNQEHCFYGLVKYLLRHLSAVNQSG